MNARTSLLVWALFLIPQAIITAKEGDHAPVVKLKQGELQGVVSKTRNGADFYAYWGIPYAKPPKRFQPPEPPAIPGWKGKRSAAKPAPYCLQVPLFEEKVSGAEDCLFANVFTRSTDSKGSLKPVIVYIHPGAFMFGTGNMFGARYLLDEDVVLVTFNYRLSSLGFLNVGHFDDKSPDNSSLATGNMGLKDQIQLLKWVKDNIKEFGGDPGKITLSGTSAGAVSTTYHLLSPLSKGYFRNAIAASGTALNSFSLSANPTFYAKELGKALNCPTSEAKKLVECLLKKDAKEIIEKSQIHPVPEWPLDPIIPFGPSIEKPNSNAEVFLSEHPETLLREGKFQKVPFMTGVTKDEGVVIHAGGILSNPDLTRILNENWNKILPISLNFEGKIPKSKWDEASEEIRAFYLGSKDASVERNGEELERMYTEGLWFHATKSTVEYLAKGTDVYPYVFDYWTKDSGYTDLYPKLEYTGKVLHGDDALHEFSGHVFGHQLNPSNAEANEFSKKYVKMLVSFAVNGVPDASILGGPKWEKTTNEEASNKKPLRWYRLGKKLALEPVSFADRLKFWDDLYQKHGAGGREEL